ncbi:ATP-binding protein [Geomesophilobacter sediminis]|uniref:histidine kinase n=1 Tax=Geomesophilobacter sediminis TaxID=2798584 RepID=A0A8J7JFD6_9BACT|nr:ATP-binding protein [Geomesophilobacter sediminis]MBJ6724989.1 response regulator [Geomesophilobacter sediminis]
MTTNRTEESRIALLQERVNFLEESNLNYLRTLDVVTACSELQSDVYRDKDPSFVLKAMFEQLQRLFPFSGQAMYTVSPSSEFVLTVCEPFSMGGWLQNEINAKIEDGTFAWALNQNHPVIVPTLSGEDTLLLHVLATNSRIRGMYAGILGTGHLQTEVSSLNALSTILIYTAYAVENAELTEMLKEHMQNLENRVQQRTRELEAALVRAEEATRAKSVFLANMSHEIRTPLNGVLGLARILMDTRLNQEQKGYLESLNVSAENLLCIINEILDLSKIEAGKVALESTDFPLRDFLVKSMRPFELRGREKGLAVQLALDDRVPPHVTGDQVRLGQILTNLVGNALKFTSHGSITVSCQLEGIEAGRAALTFSVIDTGIGIPEHAISKIFEKFSQADSSTTRLYGGTGLGLSISKNLVELMGGELAVESREGVGSTFHFTITLPIAAAPETTAEEEGELVGELRPLRILVADDVPLNQLITEKFLSKTGSHLIDCAGNGREAVEKWAAGSYDLVFMDVQMPEMDGLEASRRIREAERQRGGRVHICAMTANAMKEDGDICRQAGMDSYLSKPVQEKDLVAVVRKVAGGKEPSPVAQHHPEPEKALPPSDVEVFDRDDLLERLDGAEDLLAKFLRMFIESIDEMLPELERAVREMDPTAIHFRAHTIAGSAANISASQIRDLARDMEYRAKGGDLAETPSLLAQLEEAFGRFRGMVAHEVPEG